MNEIKVQVELCTEDRARLDAILAELKELRNCGNCVDAAVKYIEADSTEKTTADEPKQTAEEEPAPKYEAATAEKIPAPEAPKEEPATTSSGATLADIQQKVVALSVAGKKAEVREIITAYATKVSAIPEDKIAEVLEKLNALEG